MEAVNLDREFPGRYDLSLGSPYCHPLLSSGSLPLSLRPAGRSEPEGTSATRSVSLLTAGESEERSV